MSATYCNEDSRKKILEAICWSFQALCASAYLFLFFLMLPTWNLPKPIGPKKNPVPSTAYPVTGSGDGRFPTHDPWGKEFTKSYNKDRWKLGGQKIAGPFKGCLEGIQGDQDYVRAMMTPARFWANNSSISYNFLFFFRSTNGALSKFFFLWPCPNLEVFSQSKCAVIIAGPWLGCTHRAIPKMLNSSTQTSGSMQPIETRCLGCYVYGKIWHGFSTFRHKQRNVGKTS